MADTSTKVAFGFFIVCIVLVLLLVFGVNCKSCDGGGGSDKSKIPSKVTELIKDWESVCPLEKELRGDNSSITIEYPRCDVISNFDLYNYDNSTVIAFLMAFNGIRFDFMYGEKAPAASLSWAQVKEQILYRVTAYLK